ncbi:hypothetical protein FB45DRAFT_1011930, partial [Roridomyces roridus]
TKAIQWLQRANFGRVEPYDAHGQKAITWLIWLLRKLSSLAQQALGQITFVVCTSTANPTCTFGTAISCSKPTINPNFRKGNFTPIATLR